MHEVETFSQSIYNGWTVTDSRFGSLVDYDSKSAKVQMYPTKQKKLHKEYRWHNHTIILTILYYFL